MSARGASAVFVLCRSLLFLQGLKGIGVAIAADDCGSGQTSLRYLNQLPISKLKIDRSFIQHLSADSKVADITRSIIDLRQKPRVSVLVEGVEDETQLQMLKNRNCDQVQGYYFPKPVVADAIENLIDQNNHQIFKKAVGE